MTTPSCIIRDEHTPDLTARGFMRRHLHGGVVIDVPIADPVEHPDAMRYVREREAREAVYAPTSSVGSGVAVRCVCWHRSSGDHAADCPVADTGDLLPPWRDVTEVRREYRGTDATGRRVLAEVSSVVKRPPVERASSPAKAPSKAPSKTPKKTPKKTPQKPGAQKSDSTSRPDLFTLGVTA